jgi:hypothetical protein
MSHRVARGPCVVAFAAAGALALPCAALPDLWVNPGSMGPNALPSQPGEPPWIERQLSIRLEATGQRTSAGDLSAVPAFRLEAPIGRWASVISEGRPVEWWSVSARTRDDWALDRGAGVAPGDLLFGAKLALFDGGRKWPSFAVRQLTKTTTGKGFRERRFTNAPAYLLDLLVAQRLGHAKGAALEAWANAGFFAWQQGRDGQNDAFHWSTTVAGRFEGGSFVRLDARGYSGWQAYDRPVVVGLGGEWVASEHLALSLAVNRGLRDAPAFEARLGLVVRLAPFLPRAAED